MEKEGTKFTFWADAESKDPVQVEVDIPLDGRSMKFVMKDFVFDAVYDDALFSLEPPAGFSVRKLDLTKTIDDAQKKTPTEHVVTILTLYADNSGGKFPAKFDDWAAYGKVIAAASQKKDADETVATEFGASIGSIVPFLMTTGKDNWGYLGNGVTMGEKDKLIFWYEDAETKAYHGIYGDLTARELKADEVPKAAQ